MSMLVLLTPPFASSVTHSNSPSAVPPEPLTFNLTLDDSTLAGVPVISPVLSLIESPSGSPVAFHSVVKVEIIMSGVIALPTLLCCVPGVVSSGAGSASPNSSGVQYAPLSAAFGTHPKVELKHLPIVVSQESFSHFEPLSSGFSVRSKSSSRTPLTVNPSSPKCDAPLPSIATYPFRKVLSATSSMVDPPMIALTLPSLTTRDRKSVV